jgi:adenine-specific DNA-methyltransferase
MRVRSWSRAFCWAIRRRAITRSTVSPAPTFSITNLIFGDNLLALKALEQEYTGKVKCVFIDPPYNTGSAFTHYDDGVEHSIWLSLIRDRLEIIRRLLSEDGSLWITIDDNEAHYLKVICDEIFGRPNFVASIAWQKVYTSKNSAKLFSAMHDHVLVYAKAKDNWHLNQLPRSEKQDRAYSNPDNDPRGLWKSTPLHARNFYSQGSYEVTSPTGRTFSPPPGRYWAISRESFDNLQNDGRLWWGRDGTGTPNKKSFLSEVKQGVSPSTIWFYDEAGHNAEAKNEINSLALSKDVFITPKPEKLIRQVLTIATKPGDLVLDSFAGSGTTGAVAHKMGRRWIMVELGEHCHTHIIPRLKKVIDGEDQGGISQGGELERRWRLPLLPPRPQPVAARPLGPVDHQQGLQRRNAGSSDLQTGRLHLRTQRRALLATRQEYRERFHLRHYAKPDAGTVAGLER